MKNKLIKYYVNYYRELIPCYLIKDGYLPCNEYNIFLKNGKDMYNNGYTVEDFCIFCDSNKDVFRDLKEAKVKIKKEIKKQFQENIESLIKNREKSLNDLENIK